MTKTLIVTSHGSGSFWSQLAQVLANGQVVPWIDAGISRLGSDSLAIGDGVNGDTSGLLTLSTCLLYTSRAA